MTESKHRCFQYLKRMVSFLLSQSSWTWLLLCDTSTYQHVEASKFIFFFEKLQSGILNEVSTLGRLRLCMSVDSLT